MASWIFRRISPLLFATAIVWGSPAHAGVPACNESGPDLDPSTPGVTYDDPHFDIGGKNFPVEVFSLANPAPWAPNFICLRYELRNVGSDTIPLLYWDLVDDSGAYDLKPTDPRLSRTRRRPSASKQAVVGPSSIQAFRHEVVTTIAWLTIEDWEKANKKAAAIPKADEAGFHFQRVAELDPAAAKAVEAQQIPDVEVAVFEPTGDPLGDLPPVADTLRSGFGTLNSWSQAFNWRGKEARYAIQGIIRIEPGPNVKVDVFAPALIAMRTAETAERFLQLLDKSSHPLENVVEKGTEFSIERQGTLPRLFAVEHPITIRWSSPGGSGSACIEVASYSLFPISVGQNYCVR